MFGRMNVIPVLDYWNAAGEVACKSGELVERLLEVADHPKIKKWIQFPKALFVFLVVPGDPDSGAFYLYDRSAQVWYWLDFDDENFGGYSISDFDHLVRDCKFLDLVEHPQLLAGSEPWILTPGSRPRQNGEATPSATGNGSVCE